MKRLRNSKYTFTPARFSSSSPAMTSQHHGKPLSRGSRIAMTLIIALVFILPAAGVHAMSLSNYANESVLAEGTWVRVKVEQQGMQFISAATLRSLGFDDPAKVNVYGYGGRPLPEYLSSTLPDDLPLVASTHTSKGLYFFGYNYIRWDSTTSQQYLSMVHTMNPYAEESWYYLSDRPLEDTSLPLAATISPDGLTPMTQFRQMLLHEQDMTHPGTSGRVNLGEDFRSTTRRTFNFTLTDLAEGSARARVGFGYNAASSSPATLSFSANGTSLSASSGDQVTGSGVMKISSIIKTIPDPAERLSFEISLTPRGTVTAANLDYIEIEYPRQLKLNGGELHFYSSLTTPSAMQVSGVEESTIIWEITDPKRPALVDYTRSGSTAIFGCPTGYHEFIAFTPDKCGQSITKGENVANQSIHSLPIPDMLIISPAEYTEASETLAAHHRQHDNLNVEILTPEAIYHEFSSGTPDVTAFRKLLKMWYDRGLALDTLSSASIANIPALEDRGSRILYCLIMSRPTYDHKQLMETTRAANAPRVPIWQSNDVQINDNSYSTDDYIGMLDESYSAETLSTQMIHVSVGRFPVLTAAEAKLGVDKYLDYVNAISTGSWRNQMMMIADDADSGVHLNQSEDCYSLLSTTGRGSNYLFERLYLDSYPIESGPTGFTYPEPKSKMLRLWRDGVSLIYYIGHASIVGWGHEDLLNWQDINSLENSNLPFLYAATCDFARWDEDAISGAEVLWKNPKGGIIATVCPSRTVGISYNGLLSHAFAKHFFDPETGMGRRIGDIIRLAKNDTRTDRGNRFSFTLMGDPLLKFPVPEYSVSLDSLAGHDMSLIEDSDSRPILKARSRAILSGRILDNDGNLIPDFNGTVELMLYDAEKVIATNGNQGGVVSYYNDRKTRLYRGIARVVNGYWKTTVTIPSEIENNYSPARFTYYACSDDGRESHGQTDQFYIYGYDTEAEEDTEGPLIEYLALNREDFTDGMVVHSSPVVLARVSDPSGINLSDAGIGHKISLVLDDKTTFDDVNSYFSPDPDDPEAGSLIYPLTELSAGNHQLKFTVWDNANNSSSSTIDFTVAVAKQPEIYSLTTDVNPAREKVNFALSTDRPMAKVECMIEVFDLNGRRVWSTTETVSTDILASINTAWDLCDASGARVPRGIYLYRATITSEEGSSVTASRKLAVTAP